MRRVQKTKSCWYMRGRSKKREYKFIYSKKLQKSLAAHRVSYILHHGSIGGELNVCHKCDNPRCVRPDHLFAGSQFENILDYISKTYLLKSNRRLVSLRIKMKITKLEFAKLFGFSTVNGVLKLEKKITMPAWAIKRCIELENKLLI